MDAESYRRYSADRRQQLVAGGFAFWVFSHNPDTCGGRHEDLAGVSLPPDDPFWNRFYPPLDEECACYVLGARSRAGIIRLGGDPDRKAP